MKRIYLHAGLHKTGTTAFQTTARVHAAWLTKHQVYFPSPGSNYGSWTGGLHAIPLQFRGRTISPNHMGIEEYLRDFEQSNCASGLISSEGFCFLDRKQIGELKTKLAAYDVHPIMVFRHPVDLIRALYCSDGVYNRKTSSGIFFKSAKNSWRLRYDVLAASWQRHFPQTKFLKYEEAEDIVRALFREIGVVSPLFQAAPYVRESLPLPLAELNAALYSRTELDDEAYIKNCYTPLKAFAVSQEYREMIGSQRFSPKSRADQHTFLASIEPRFLKLEEVSGLDFADYRLPVAGETVSEALLAELHDSYQFFLSHTYG